MLTQFLSRRGVGVEGGAVDTEGSVTLTGSADGAAGTRRHHRRRILTWRTWGRGGGTAWVDLDQTASIILTPEEAEGEREK